MWSWKADLGRWKPFGREDEGWMLAWSFKVGAYMQHTSTDKLCRRLNAKRRLVWVGRHLAGKPSGVCWSFASGGGAVVGNVDSEGKLTGDEVKVLDELDAILL